MKAIWAKLQAAVKAGKMTQKEADAKMIAIKKKYAKKHSGKFDLKAIQAKLQAAVKAGKMTQKEADAKMAALKKGKKAKK